MAGMVLLGDPAAFRIQAGLNPHTRDRWGRRKGVDLPTAVAQWNELKRSLEDHGVKVHVLPPVADHPGLVFPANAGFRHGEIVYLSNLNPARSGEREYYRQALTRLGLSARDLSSEYRFEGEADFIPLGDPSGDPAKTVYLFTYGRIETPRWAPRWGLPPYRRIVGFRSDKRVLPALQEIVGRQEILPLELIDEAHYHGDTALCSFGPQHQYLLVYREVLSQASQEALSHRFGDRLVPLNPWDGRLFAANSFQVTTEYYGETVRVLLTPDGLTQGFYEKVRSYGVIPCPVDVSEFLLKGGGAVKCMLLDLEEE